MKEYADGQEMENNPIVKNKHGVSILGTEYRVGDYLAVGVNETLGQPVFEKVKSMEWRGGSYQFTCCIADTIFASHYHAYQVMYVSDEQTAVKHSDLPPTCISDENREWTYISLHKTHDIMNSYRQ